MLRRKKRGKRETLEKIRSRVLEPGERSSQTLGVPQREKKKAKKGRRRRVRSVTAKREGVRRSKRRGTKSVSGQSGTKEANGGLRVKNLRKRKTPFNKDRRAMERVRKKKKKKKKKLKIKLKAQRVCKI